jgi:hypothetical protein
MINLYEGRYLSDGYPDLEKMGVEYYQQHQANATRFQDIFECIERLIDINQGLKTVCIVGCGPNPNSVREMLKRGYDAVGIEPIGGFAKAAANSLEDSSRIRKASSENLFLPDESRRIMLFEHVLEHVDSPLKAY